MPPDWRASILCRLHGVAEASEIVAGFGIAHRRTDVRCLLTALLVLAIQPAIARGFTARSLISICEPIPNQSKADTQAASDACSAYILGLTDGMYMMQLFASSSKTPCMPMDQAIDVTKARRIFSDYLTRHPQAADNSAGMVIAFAIAEGFPCRK